MKMAHGQLPWTAVVSARRWINVGVRHLAGRRVKANLPYSRVFCSAAPQFLLAEGAATARGRGLARRNGIATGF
jgi:hypothetical protein